MRAKIGRGPTAVSKKVPFNFISICETWKRTAMIADRLDVLHRRCLRTILDTSWCDHATNEQVTRRAGMERLQDIVTTKTRTWLATLSDGKDKDPPIQQCTGCQKTAEERGGGRRRHGEAPTKKT